MTYDRYQDYKFISYSSRALKLVCFFVHIQQHAQIHLGITCIFSSLSDSLILCDAASVSTNTGHRFEKAQNLRLKLSRFIGIKVRK